MKHPALAPCVLACLSVLAVACGESAPERGTAPGSEPSGSGPIAERISDVLALEGGLPRARAFANLLTDLDTETMPEVRGALEEAQLDSSDGDVELLLFTTWWAGFDPQAALDWASRDWRAPYGATPAVFRSWAERDPKEAWDAIGSIRPALRNDAQSAVVASWYRSDAPGLYEFIPKLKEPELQQRAMEVLALERTKELGAEAALEWAEGLGSPEFRDQMRKRVAGAAGLVDPESAAAWATPQIDDSVRTNGLARRIATRWVLSDPEAAMAWLSTLPAGGTRDDGVLEAYRDWLSLSPLEAVRWIHGRDYERWLEPALALYARAALGRGQPESALTLVQKFQDEGLRESTLTYIARNWLRRDREAADAWIQQSDLPEGVKIRAYMTPSGEELKERAARRRAREDYELAPMDES